MESSPLCRPSVVHYLTAFIAMNSGPYPPTGGTQAPRQQTYQQPQGRSVDYGQRMSKGEGANTVSGRFEIKGGALILP